MKNYFKPKTLLLLGVGLLSISSWCADADTLVKQTTISQKDIPNTYKVDFSAMDLNHDGILSRTEVGRKLFYIFDTDGNDVIDNNEFKKAKILTIIPLEKKELTMVDMDDDGVPDKTQYTSEDFSNFSMLNRFDKNNDGLSAEEFIGQPFLKMDTNRDKVIDIDEWRAAYIKSMSPLTAKPYLYNQ